MKKNTIVIGLLCCYISLSHATEKPSLSPVWAIPVAPVSLILPGTAHYLKGDKETASKFFTAHAFSFGSFFASGLVMGLTGAADIVSPIMIPLLLISGTSWFSLAAADMIGAFSPAPDVTLENKTKHQLSFEYKSFDDFTFNTKSYQTVNYTYNNLANNIQIEYMNNDKQTMDIYKISGEYQLFQLPEYDTHSGLYSKMGIRYENNRAGFFNQATLSYQLMTQLPLTLLGNHLTQLTAIHSVGFQHILTDYHSPYSLFIDTNTSIVGSALLRWQNSQNLTSLLGYTHQRDGIISALSTGFTGVYWVAAEYSFQPMIVTGRYYANQNQMIDLEIKFQW